MIDAIRDAVISCGVSAVISGIFIYYMHSYLDGKRRENEERMKHRREERLKRDVLEQQRRHTAGRCLFWLHDAAVNGAAHANGDLEHAFRDYVVAEDTQKAYERELLAEHADENRGA